MKVTIITEDDDGRTVTMQIPNAVKPLVHHEIREVEPWPDIVVGGTVTIRGQRGTVGDMDVWLVEWLGGETPALPEWVGT